MRVKAWYTAVTLLTVSLVGVPLRAAQAADIRLLVYGEHAGENVVYRYTVVNNGNERFNNFTIGSVFDAARGDDVPELGRLPAGWTFGREGETGTEILLDPAATTQPAGWTAKVYGQEGTQYFYLEWHASRGGTARVSAGQTLSGFSVTVPRQEDPRMPFVKAGNEAKFVDGHFQVGYWLNRQHLKFRGSIEKQDSSPPIMSVTATPLVLWPPNSKHVPIAVNVAARDDYDPYPEIKLESITANETLGPDDVVGAEVGTDDRSFGLKATRAGGNPAGRIYTITYSATDGTGNKATASTTVTVPHDQR